MEMIAQFCLRLICGMSLMWCGMPRRQITSGYFRIQMLVVLSMSVLAALAQSTSTTESSFSAGVVSAKFVRPACIGLAVASFLGSVMWTLERRRLGTVFVFLIAAVSTALVLGLCPVSGSVDGRAVLSLASELSTALLLGGAVSGMLLGHWYLTAPTMSIAPLSRVNAYFGAAGFSRLLLSAIALVLAWEQITGQSQWLWLSLRWLAGICGPLAVAVMVWRILKYRNTQSATGVLFVGVILVFIGELSAALLQRELNVPL